MIHGKNPAPATLPAQLRLTGEDLVLREWTENDLPAMTELFDDPEIAHWTPLASPFDTAPHPTSHSPKDPPCPLHRPLPPVPPPTAVPARVARPPTWPTCGR
ncbi:GNAT family N-acetyltransferase [Streptomyces sp. NBC_01515]|uniref:GNAT family N-acetyltransferase n=1 Tax=Streptomyces sp. NBC_01515 TaxID=2903890 RepID=UPI0038645149